MNSLEYILISPRNLELVEKKLEWPPVSGKGILCKTLITGISPGTELAAWKGETPLRPSGGYPRKIGYQNISEVIAISGKNEKIQIGDQIYTNQSHCSLFLSNEEDVLAIVPRTRDIKEYIFSYMYHMSLCALSVDKRNSLDVEMKIAVFGGGALGNTIVEIASSLGYLVVLVSDSIYESKLRSTKITVMSRGEFRKKYEETPPVFHQSIVCTNRWDDYYSSLSTTCANGTIVLLGFPGRDGSLPLKNPFEPKYFYVNNLVINSLPTDRKSLFTSLEKNLSLHESMSDIVNRISQGTLGQTFSTAEILDYVDLETAYAKLSENRKSNGSLVLSMVSTLISATIVGYGRMGSGYGRDYKLLPKIWNPYSLREAIDLTPRMKLRAICDLNTDAMLNLPADIERFTSYKLMIEKIKPNFIAVTTRTQERAEIAICALENGIKMMHLEKPLCNSKMEVSNLQNQFLKYEAKFTYGTIRRYLTPYKFVKNLVQSGEFGNITKITVNYGREWLFWTHPHSIDIILFFVGEYTDMTIIEISGDMPEIQVVGNQTNVITDPILDSARLVFDNNIIAEITSESTSTISVICENTQFHIMEDGRKVLQVNSAGREQIVWAEEDEDAPAGYASVLRELIIAGTDSEDVQLSSSMKDAFKGQLILFDMCIKLAAHNLKGSEPTEEMRFLGKAKNGLFA